MWESAGLGLPQPLPGAAQSGAKDLCDNVHTEVYIRHTQAGCFRRAGDFCKSHSIYKCINKFV